MTEALPPRTPPGEDLVRVGGRAIPFHLWEQELMLRTAAWVALIQGLATACVAGLEWMRWGRLAVDGPMAGIVGLVVGGCLVVRSRDARLTLIGAGIVCVLLRVSGGSSPFGSSSGWGDEEMIPSVGGLVYAAGGVLLFRRKTLGRDVLLILGGAWLIVVMPELLDELEDFTRGGRFEDLFEVAAWCLPAAFVVLTMLSRAGQSVFAESRQTAALAPYASLFSGPPTARGWASLVVVVLVVLVSPFMLGPLEKLIRHIT